MEVEKPECLAIIIEGPLAVGKTTACKRVLRTLSEIKGKGAAWGLNTDIDDVLLAEEKPPKKLLDAYYRDGKKYALALQIAMQQTRTTAERDTIKPRKPEGEDTHSMMLLTSKLEACSLEQKNSLQLSLLDRSRLGDAIFTMCQYLEEKMDKEEMEVYQDLTGIDFRDMNTFFSEYAKGKSSILLLYDDIEHCYLRYLADPTREHATIPKCHFVLLDDLYFHYMVKLFLSSNYAPTRVMPWKEYQARSPAGIDVGAVNILKAAQDLQRQTATYANSVEHVEECPRYGHLVDCYVYGMEHNYMQVFLRLLDMKERNNHEDKELLQNKNKHIQVTEFHFASSMEPRSRVYVPEVARLRCESEQAHTHSIGKRAQEYGILLYQEEYKKIVYYHLSLGHTVCFYRQDNRK